MVCIGRERALVEIELASLVGPYLGPKIFVVGRIRLTSILSDLLSLVDIPAHLSRNSPVASKQEKNCQQNLVLNRRPLERPWRRSEEKRK